MICVRVQIYTNHYDANKEKKRRAWLITMESQAFKPSFADVPTEGARAQTSLWKHIQPELSIIANCLLADCNCLSENSRRTIEFETEAEHMLQLPSGVHLSCQGPAKKEKFLSIPRFNFWSQLESMIAA